MVSPAVNACAGCNLDLPLREGGLHFDLSRCAHVEFAVSQFLGAVMMSVPASRVAAVRAAQRCDGGMLWISSGPHEYWAVMKEL